MGYPRWDIPRRPARVLLHLAATALSAAALGACGGGGAPVTAAAASQTVGTSTPTTTTSGGTTSEAGTSALSAAAQLGKQIFEDTTLSVSGKQSCATCHVAKYAFAGDPTSSGPDHGLPVPLGGPNMDQPGFRNAPSLKYASYAPNFYFDADGNPNGGFFRDGRAATLELQAVQPFTTSFEMANPDAAAVIEKLKTRPYLSSFESLYGSAVLDDPATALARMGAAVAAYEREGGEFHPFTSKYDYWQKQQAQLTAQELNGLKLFNDATKGNCNACHPSTSADGITPPLFTDFSFDNLGLPRNAKIPANADRGAPSYTPTNSDDGVHAYYDLGICGPLRDNANRNLFGICGQFKVPTLRNLALTAPYFHNGQFATIAQALAFYVRRDTNPEQFYPAAPDGSVTKFDDLPAIYGGLFVVNVNEPASDAGYVGNVNTSEIPYNRPLGGDPALTPAEIDDVVAFLCTLTDGYDPDHPSAQVLPPQCQAAVSATAASN